MSGTNFSQEQLLRLLMNTKGDSGSVAEELVKNKLSDEQRQRVETVLRDKNALNSLLASEQAQQLLKKLGGGK